MFGKNKKQGKDKELEKKDKEQIIVDDIKKKYENAKNAKSEFVDTWKKCIKAYSPEGIGGSKPSYRSDVNINYIFSTIETIKPIMLNENLKFDVIPRMESDFDTMMKCREALREEWDRASMKIEVARNIHTMLTLGTSIQGLFWDSREKEIKPTLINPFNFFPDPAGLTLDECSYVIYATYKNMHELAKKYPDKAQEIIDKATHGQDEDLSIGKNMNNSRNQVLYLECYMKDYTMEEYEVQDSSGNPIKRKQYKYPNLRRTIVVGDTLVSDGDSPYQDGGNYPFVVFKCYDIPFQFWGMGEVEQLMSVQKGLNDLNNQIIDNARLTGNPQRIMDKNCGVDTSKLTNKPGLIIKKNPGTEYRMEAPPPIPSYVQNMVDIFKNDVEHISGVFESTRGGSMGSITSASGINTLVNTSQGRIKLKADLMEEGLSRLGAMWLNRIIQFWSKPRMIRTMVTFRDAQRLQEQGMELHNIINSDKMLLETMEIPMFTSVKGTDLDGIWEVKIATGSTLPTNKLQRLQQMIQLSQTMAEDGLPMIDRKTILQLSELDNVEEILSRFDAVKEQQSQQAQQEEEKNMNWNLEQQQKASEMKAMEAQITGQQKMQLEQMKLESNAQQQLVTQIVQAVLSQMGGTEKDSKNNSNKKNK